MTPLGITEVVAQEEDFGAIRRDCPARMLQNRLPRAKNLPAGLDRIRKWKRIMGEKMKNSALYHLVANTGDLAALPTTVVDLLYLFKEADASAQKVVEILNRDPA